MRLIATALFCALAVPALAQVGPYKIFQRQTAATAAILTVQQPATASKTVIFDKARVYCSAACTFSVERDGTAATTTAGTIAKLTSSLPNATATAWTASNVGSGTQISETYDLAAGGSLELDISKLRLVGNGTAINVSLRVASASGTITTAISWFEL
jgi:type IV secretory pathway TrbL component